MVKIDWSSQNHLSDVGHINVCSILRREVLCGLLGYEDDHVDVEFFVVRIFTSFSIE